MNPIQERGAEALRAVVNQYAAAQAEVVRVYFEQPHTKEDHLEILLDQMGREGWQPPHRPTCSYL